MIRVKTLPASWHEKLVKATGTKKTQNTCKDKDTPQKTSLPRNLSFEAILEENNGTYRIKEVIQL